MPHFSCSDTTDTTLPQKTRLAATLNASAIVQAIISPATDNNYLGSIIANNQPNNKQHR